MTLTTPGHLDVSVEAEILEVLAHIEAKLVDFSAVRDELIALQGHLMELHSRRKA